MRLDVLEHDYRAPARLFRRVAQLVTRHELDDVIRTSLHRPEFFGRAFLGYVPEVLRRPSFWTAGEREYMAAFSSRLNECPYCVRVHSEVTRIESRGELTPGSSAGVRPELAATLRLLEKVTREPDAVTGADIDAVRAAGVPEDGIVDALHVNVIFNLVNRLANAFGFSWDSNAHVQTGAKVCHRLSYKVPGFVLR